MRKFIGLCLSVGLLFLSLNSSYAESIKKDAAVTNKKLKVLAVVLSKQASIHVLTKKPGYYHLKLIGVNPKVIYFSNSPVRISGQVETQKFVDQWRDGNFKKIPPNAVMEAVTLNPKNHKLQDTQTSYPIILTHPTYTPLANKLSFIIKAMPNNKDILPAIAKSDYVAIFVDHVCLTCVG